MISKITFNHFNNHSQNFMVRFSKSLHNDLKKDFKVEKATIHDSPFIAEGIIHGFGEDLCRQKKSCL